jgi:hypothetical protein
MKIIFLDIDGVMNSEVYHSTLDTKKKNWRRFDPEAVKMLIKLVEEFDAKIVVSSLWRFVAKKELATELKESHLVNFLHQDWKTPVIEPGHRGKEIKMWLDQHPDINEFVILDDDSDVLEVFSDKFVRTDYYDGLQAEHYYKAREILEGEKLK